MSGPLFLPMISFTFTSLMSEIADPFCRDLAGYLADQTGHSVNFAAYDSYRQRELMLDRQQIELAWICGLLYTRKVLNSDWRYAPLVAPCMIGDREPVYYADVIVRRESPFCTFNDLLGAVWAYNEVASFSGYQAVCAFYISRGARHPFDNRAIKSCSHLRSINLIRQGRADAAAIDSTVLRMACERNANLMDDLRIVHRIGPYSMPPLVFSQYCTSTIRHKIQQALLQMHLDSGGKQILRRWQIERFAAVEDGTYNDIRRADQIAKVVSKVIDDEDKCSDHPKLSRVSR